MQLAKASCGLGLQGSELGRVQDAYRGAYGDEEAEEPVTKIFILMGGDGLQRQESIRSGLNAYLMLQSHPDIQVCWLVLCSAVLGG